MTKTEYYKILFDLGLLDDEEDWELFKEQEKRFEEGLDAFSEYERKNTLASVA